MRNNMKGKESQTLRGEWSIIQEGEFTTKRFPLKEIFKYVLQEEEKLFKLKVRNEEEINEERKRQTYR